ncbi:MAG: cytochrome d ubiquinol oxidase subunit II [Planctomycetota bacterium]|nr:cytochrome d ubiquinol oxidase subunit II [Planctomycetota bacterium]
MGPEFLAALLILLAVTLYVLLGGADFGAGVWEFNLALSVPRKERELLHRAIGPVWEANHVWLIFALVLLFQAFPTAYAAISRALWVPLFLALIGIVFRGAAFAYRSYSSRAAEQRLWQAVFAVASTSTPFFLGAAAGAIASGSLEVTATGGFDGNYLTGWVHPLSIFTAFFGVGLCAYLASIYLTREAAMQDDPDLVNVWRRRALATGAWMGILAMAGLPIMATTATALWEGFLDRALSIVALSLASGLFSLGALWLRRFTAAALSAGVAAATIIVGWGLAQYPALVPPSITIASAKSPDSVIIASLWVIGGGAILVLPSLGFLIYLFKFRRESDQSASETTSPRPSGPQNTA